MMMGTLKGEVYKKGIIPLKHICCLAEKLIIASYDYSLCRDTAFVSTFTYNIFSFGTLGWEPEYRDNQYT